MSEGPKIYHRIVPQTIEGMEIVRIIHELVKGERLNRWALIERVANRGQENKHLAVRIEVGEEGVEV